MLIASGTTHTRVRHSQQPAQRRRAVVPLFPAAERTLLAVCAFTSDSRVLLGEHDEEGGRQVEAGKEVRVPILRLRSQDRYETVAADLRNSAAQQPSIKHE